MLEKETSRELIRSGRYVAGNEVRAFHPQAFGVMYHGRIVKVGRVWLTIDFGLRGIHKVAPRDVTPL